jgi:hypothetical protein
MPPAKFSLRYDRLWGTNSRSWLPGDILVIPIQEFIKRMKGLRIEAAAPLLAAVAHITEEFAYPGGFADWDRAYRSKIRSSITPRFHLIINLLLVFLCVSVGLAGTAGGVANLGVVRIRRVIPPQHAVAGWPALAALLLSNVVFHVVGTVQTRRVSPGVRTGLRLYVPLAAYGYWHFFEQRPDILRHGNPGGVARWVLSVVGNDTSLPTFQPLQAALRRLWAVSARANVRQLFCPLSWPGLDAVNQLAQASFRFKNKRRCGRG